MDNERAKYEAFGGGGGQGWEPRRNGSQLCANDLLELAAKLEAGISISDNENDSKRYAQLCRDAARLIQE